MLKRQAALQAFDPSFLNKFKLSRNDPPNGTIFCCEFRVMILFLEDSGRDFFPIQRLMS